MFGRITESDDRFGPDQRGDGPRLTGDPTGSPLLAREVDVDHSLRRFMAARSCSSKATAIASSS
jgi:hypothetical protein